LNSNIHWKHLLWLPINGALAFLLPAVVLGAIGASENSYYAAVIIIVCVMAIAYAKKSNLKIMQSLKPGWALGLIFGVFVGLIFLSFAALSNPALHSELARPDALETIIKSALFGIVSAILVTVLPFVIVWRALGDGASGAIRKSIVAVMAIIAVAVVTFLYSFGMPGSLQGDLQAIFTKTMMAGVPTLISGSPLAAPISHVFLHLSEAAAEPSAASLDSANQSAKTTSGRQDPTAGREKSTMEGIN
jgi:hypothetical protein